MAKKVEYMKGRNEGMAFALQIAEKRGLEGLREECRFRGATNVPSQIPKEVYDEYEQRVKVCTIDTVMSMSLIALVDAFGFGRKVSVSTLTHLRNKNHPQMACFSLSWVI